MPRSPGPRATSTTTRRSRRAVIADPPRHDERPDPLLEGGAPSSPDRSVGAPPEEADGDGAFLHLSRQQFEEAVGEALDLVPARLMDQLDNVVFLVEDEPPPEDPELLGVYDGVPLTDRDLAWGGHLPDRVTIFSGPLQRMCADREELLEEIAVTVVHEIAHHFGIDDETLHELGWA